MKILERFFALLWLYVYIRRLSALTGWVYLLLHGAHFRECCMQYFNRFMILQEQNDFHR